MVKKITVKVVTKDDGVKTFEKVSMVRIKSRKHTLLIMEDYVPVIGEVQGEVDVVMEESTECFENIKGYYMHKQNLFRLLVTDDLNQQEQELEEDRSNEDDQ